MRKALDAKTPPETYPCGHPLQVQGLRDYTDWLLVRLGQYHATLLGLESYVDQQGAELFSSWVGPDGRIYGNPMDMRLRERTNRAIATLPADADQRAWLRQQLAEEKEESWIWL